MNYVTVMEDRRQFTGAGTGIWMLFLLLTINNATNPLFAQRQMTLGAMQNVPQLNLINPAFPVDSASWYVGIPLLSSMNAAYRNSSFTPEQFGFGSPGGPDFFKAMDFADSLNQAYGEAYVEDLAFGINVGKNFFSLSVGERVTASIDYPQQLLKWLGYEQEGVEIPLGRVFELTNWNFAAAHYREIAVGAGRRLLGDKLILAGRVKLLLGQASLQSQNYNLRLWHRPDQDYNYEITGRMDIMASGFDRFGEGGSPFQLFGSSNTGVAFDLGAQLKLGKVSIFASVTDLGRIDWKKNNTFTTIKDIAVNGDELVESAIDDLVQDRERGATSFSTELVTKVYGGGQVEIGKRHAVSLMVNPRLYLGRTELNGSLAYRFSTGKFVDLIASYNYMEMYGNEVGFGATVNLRPVQLYFATDKAVSVFNRNSQKDFQFSAGINLLFGQPKQQEKIIVSTPPVDIPDGGNSYTPGRPQADVPPAAMTAPEKKGVQDKYFTFYGTVIDDETDEPVEAVYVDVYVLGPDKQRELIHTSRYPGHTFNVPLFQSDLQHEISVGGYGYARNTLSFTANTPRMEYEFRMSDGIWSYDEPAPFDPNGETRLASAELRTEPEPAPEQEEELLGSAAPKDNIIPTEVDGVFEIIERTSLRSEPAAQARVMKRLGVGTTLTLLEKTDKYWWKMKLGDQVGYVKQRLLVSVQ